MADTAKNSFIVVLPNQIITIPQDSNLAWLPLFYALPKELVSKRKQYLEIPRSPYDVLRTDKYDNLIKDDAFLELVWDCYAWSVWQFIQVPRSNGYGDIPGEWTSYSGDFPLWRLCYAIQNHFRNKFETEMEWSFQKLFMMPKEMQIPWLTYQQFSNLIGNLTDMIVEEQNWQPKIDEVWKNRQMEDYSERKSTYKRDFINKWYCSWNKRKVRFFLMKQSNRMKKSAKNYSFSYHHPVMILKQEFFRNTKSKLYLKRSTEKTNGFCKCEWTDARLNRLQNLRDTKHRVPFTNAYRKSQRHTKILFQVNTENF